MTTIAWPTGFPPSALKITQQNRNLASNSTVSGGQESRTLAPAKWMVNISMPLKKNNREFVAFLMKLRGGVNYFSMYDFTRPAPYGTMRGTMTLSSAAALSDSSLVITAGSGQASKTLVYGDWLKVGNQLFMVTSSATSNGSGVITVSVEPPVRTALSGGAAVTWDKPTTIYRLNNQEAGFDVLNVGYVGGIGIDATERLT